MKKYLLLGATIILLAGGSYFTERLFLSSSAPTSTVSNATTTNAAAPSVLAMQAPAVPIQKSENAASQILTAPPSAPQTPNVTFAASGTSSGVYAPPGSTVLDAMRTLASTSDFTFSGRDYSSLGFFVDSIKGKENADGYYWILYVNGKSSDTGVSQTTLSAGDTVEWKYEKSY